MWPTVAVFLGLLVAFTYGAGDFFGGLSSRRLSPAVVVQTSQLVGLVAITATLLLPGQTLLGVDVVRGAVAGTVGLLGVLLLYRGLAVGAMAIVAPITAVGAAVLPLVWGLVTGERPGVLDLVGVALALVAVGLVSSPAVEEVEVRGRGREVMLALAAGAAFGVVFILLADTSADGGMWSVFGARAASVTVLTAVLAAARRQLPTLPPPGNRVSVAAAGILDVGANGLFVLAAREGLLSVVAVLSSLYPAATVVLARAVLHERVSSRQQVGLAAALVGVLLIAA